MISAQLYITEASSYDQVEFFDFESIELVQSKQDIRDISKVFTEFSRTFTVPASKKNNQIFKHFYNPNVWRDFPASSGFPFDIRKRVEAQLHLNYNLFKKGRIQLQSANMRGNKPYSYTLIFFGDAVKLAETLGDKTLDTLSPLASIKVPYTASNITSLMNLAQDVTIGSTTYADSLLVPLITSTERLVYDSVDNTKDYNLYPHNNQKGVDYRDLKPAIRVHTIIKAIEEQYSSISFSNDFFTVPTNTSDPSYPYYELFMWLNREKGQISLDLPQQQVTSFTAAVGSSESGMKSNSPEALGTSQQYIPMSTHIAGPVDFFIDVKITPPSPTATYNFILKKNNKEYRRFDGLQGNTHPLNMMGSDIEGKPREELPKGYFYTFYLESASAGNYGFEFKIKKNKPADISLFGTITATRVISYTGSTTISSTFELDGTTLIPNNIKIIDFLAGLFKMFNLTVTEGASGEMKIIPLDDFYSSSGDPIDITRYIDTTDSTVESALPFSEVEFKYDGLDTIFASQHEQIGGKTWGTEAYPDEDSDGNTLLNIGDKYEVTLPFEHHKFNRLSDQDDPDPSNLTSIQWGYSVNDDQNSIVGKPLLLYNILQPVASSTNTIEVVTGATSTNLFTYYIPSNSIDLVSQTAGKTAVNIQNLNFYAEVNEYDQVPFTKTLYETYYSSYISNIFDIDRRLFKFKAILPEQKIREIQLNDTIIIYDTEYLINKMTTDLLSGKTNFELINKTTLEILNETKEEVFGDNLKDLSYNVSFDGITVDNTVIKADLSQSITG